jgi:hypothetical protein
MMAQDQKSQRAEFNFFGLGARTEGRSAKADVEFYDLYRCRDILR